MTDLPELVATIVGGFLVVGMLVAFMGNNSRPGPKR